MSTDLENIYYNYRKEKQLNSKITFKNTHLCLLHNTIRQYSYNCDKQTGIWGPFICLVFGVAYIRNWHERFFARAGDASFSNFFVSPARDENRMCSHPRTGDATMKKSQEKSSQN